jgi:acetyl esterase
MPLNPQLRPLLEAMAAYPMPPLDTVTPAMMRGFSDRPIHQGEPRPLHAVRDIEIPLEGRTLSARLYLPEADTVPPLTLFLHGGGWVIGTLDTHDALCRELAHYSGSAFLSLAYRLAPEHPFPAGLDDSVDTLRWIEEQGDALGVDTLRLAVAGDSAGANLAAAAAMRIRDEGGPALRHQLLFYPVADNDFATASYRENGAPGYLLSGEMMQWFWRHYLGDPDRQDVPLAAILRAPSHSDLPSATILTAELDPLRDEGMALARKLAEGGVEVSAETAPGMIHGFASMFQAVPDAVPYLEKAGARLAAALA